MSTSLLCVLFLSHPLSLGFNLSVSVAECRSLQPSNLIAMASNLIAMASDLIAMASDLIATAFNKHQDISMSSTTNMDNHTPPRKYLLRTWSSERKRLIKQKDGWLVAIGRNPTQASRAFERSFKPGSDPSRLS